MSSLRMLRREISSAADPAKARVLAGFFKTGKGEYGEGDVFLGLTVPISRGIARRYADLPYADLRRALASRIHEERLIALLILVQRYESGQPSEKRRVFRFYLVNAARVNNWDLVDLSAPKIVGAELLRTGASPVLLDRLANSPDLWRRRIAVIATYAFIRAGNLAPTFRIVGAHLDDPRDLTHKACGWMLREAGKRDKAALVRWLASRHASMPRTMLRYAIERFPERERGAWLRRGRATKGKADIVPATAGKRKTRLS